MERLAQAGHQVSGPYRGYKGDIWEGGHREPFIVRWPGRVAPGSASSQLVSLNDIFATCAELLGDTLPENAAEDSFSFLPALVGEKNEPGGATRRTNLVNHSVHGEFAYREGGWKLVFKMPAANLEASRGKLAVVQLYNLDRDIAEENDVAREHPEIVKELTRGLKGDVDRGRSRPGPAMQNDTLVRFDVIQTARWAPPLN
jgi:arylsulfatase A-like enzyme